MRKIAVLLFLLAAGYRGLAQEALLKGSVTDTLGRKNLQNAVVSLLHQKDSVLYKFGRTQSAGHFQLNHLRAGKYILLVTYPQFADFSDEVELKEGLNDLGSIPLTLKSRLLDAVIIRNAASIRIKGDTTEFVADSFKVKEGATVEELLRRLPGFQVNARGEIVAQGRKVDKVLVDGEEFFGDDPTMATQNLSAKAVDKVQLYDTRTDQQQLTGTRTGNEGKTVNIKLKEDAKKGSFGKVNLGSDFSRYIDAKGHYNRFLGSRKVSVYGSKSDVSTGSLNWDDRRKLGFEEDVVFSELGEMYISFGGDEFNDWTLRGLPNSYTAGGLYNNKWNNGKTGLNSSYSYNRLGTSNEASTLTQNILAGQINYRNRFQNTDGLTEQHSFNLKYEWKVDSLATLKFTTTGKKRTVGGDSDVMSEFLDDSKQFINKSNQQIDNHSKRLQNDNVLTYNQKFKKKNRLISATIRASISDDQQNSLIKTQSEFYRNNAIDSSDYTDQQKLVDANSTTTGSRVTFTEPLSAKWTIVLDYSYNRNNSQSHRNTFSKNLTGKYDLADPEFSNNFDLKATSNSSMLFFRLMTPKIQGSIGSGASALRLNLLHIDSNKLNVYRFFNFTPQVNARYMLRPQTNLSVNYNGSTRQPTIDQLQPVKDNSDRLKIFIGNPRLKVTFNHRFGLGYYSSKVLSRLYYNVNFGYSIPVNAITFMNSIDISRGVQTYTPVNVNGNRNWNFFSYVNKELSNKFGYGVDLSASGGRTINFVNGERNNTHYMYSDLRLSLNYNSEKIGYLSLTPRAGYNTSRSSLQKSYDRNYWNYGGDISVNLKLPGKTEFSSNCTFNLREQFDAFAASPNQINWNASFTKKFLKNNAGRIMIVANDILNQNIGFNRTINSNFITEDRYQKVARYFMLKFEWSFNSTPIKN